MARAAALRREMPELTIRLREFDVRDCVVYAGSRTVTALGVDHLVIVETPDAVLVCRKDRAQDVKQLVDLLREKGRDDLL